MYTRSYSEPQGDGIVIPENYDGNTFRHKYIPDPPSEPERSCQSCEDAESTAEASASPSEYGGIFSLVSKSYLGRLFTGKEALRLGPMSLGNEEILIIGVALLLLFSRGKDTECAVLLLLLLLIK